MANEVRIHAKADTGQAKSELKGLQDAWSTFQKKGAEGVAIGAGAFAAAKAFSLLDDAISTTVDFMFKSVDAASSLNETIAKSEVIFGSSSRELERWADTAADSFGQSKRQALDTASGFAGLFKTVGIELTTASGYAKELTELGSDLASFFNTDVQTAIDALKSGLSGESEPLRRFNVFLSETAVSAKLAEMGIKKVGGQFTEAQKATARYQLILEQTGDAQGDFERTSDGLANTQRTLQAQMEDLQAAIGQELMPVMVELAQFARDDIVPALQEVARWTKENEWAFELLGSVWANVTGGPMAQATNEYEKQMDRAKEAAIAASLEGADAWDTGSERIASASKDAARGLGKVDDKASDAATAMAKLGRKTGTTADDFKDLVKWAEEAGETLAEAAYGPEELELAFQGAKLELKDNQDEVERLRKKMQKLEDDGKPVPRKLKREFNDAEQAVNDSKQEVIRLGTKLSGVGGISMGDLRSQFQRLGIRIDVATGKAADLWWYLNHIANVDLGTAYDNANGGRGRASGGYEAPGSEFVVGEQGKPEIVRTLPGGGAVVMPMDGRGAWGNPAAPMTTASGGGGGWGGGDTYISFNFPHAVALTPGAGQQIADAIAPVITKWQQDRRLLGVRA